MRAWVPQRGGALLEKPISLQQQPEDGGGASMTGGSEAVRKEAGKSSQGYKRDLAPADCSQDCSLSLWENLTRGSPSQACGYP